MVHAGALCHLRKKTRLQIKKQHSPIPEPGNGKGVCPSYPLKAGVDGLLRAELLQA